MHEWDEVTRLKHEKGGEKPPKLIYISEASVAQMETLRYNYL